MNQNILKTYAASFLKNLQFFGPISVPYFLDWLRVDYTRMFIWRLGKLKPPTARDPSKRLQIEYS